MPDRGRQLPPGRAIQARPAAGDVPAQGRTRAVATAPRYAGDRGMWWLSPAAHSADQRILGIVSLVSAPKAARPTPIIGGRQSRRPHLKRMR